MLSKNTETSAKSNSWLSTTLYGLSMLACLPVVVPGYALAPGQANRTHTPQPHTTWRDYGGSADSAQYSALHQINRSNVNKLQVAWTYPTGDDRKYSFNPLVVDGTMYVLAKGNTIVALNAETGKE